MRKKKDYLREESVIVDRIYTVVDNSIKTKLSSYKQCIGRFIQSREQILYDYAPINRVLFGKKEIDDFFKSTGISETEIRSILPDLYYWNDAELEACKDPFSLTNLMVLRWLLINKPNDKKLIELSYMYLTFSGKFYSVCHYKWFRDFPPKREVMDYVVNYMLSQKFDLIKEKTVFGALRNLTSTWLDKYKSELTSKDLTDERIIYIINQLYHRIYAFLRNIAKPYFEAYENKLYLNRESEDYDKENFRIVNNNSNIASSITEKVMNYMINSQVDLGLCMKVSQKGVDYYEIKAIFENILGNNNNLIDLRFVINVMIVDFIRNYPDEKDITGIKFIAHSISMKPNTKDRDIIETKNIILGWLNRSERYRRIKTQTTKNNYYKAMLAYIAMSVNIANKE